MLCAYLWVPLLPDDPELDWRQAGGRPIREGQCQCHRQSPQHLSPLCCSCRHEELCGGERKCVNEKTLMRMSFFFSLLCSRPVCAASDSICQEFLASKVCLTILGQSFIKSICSLFHYCQIQVVLLPLCVKMLLCKKICFIFLKRKLNSFLIRVDWRKNNPQ